MRLHFAALLPFLLFAPPVIAEEEYQHKIEFFQQTSDGATAICGIEQTIIFKDQINNPGLAGLHLFISFGGDAEKFFAFFKFSEGSFLYGPNGGITQGAIANASVLFDGKSLPLNNSSCQNDKMSFCGGLGGDKAGLLATAMELQGARLRFNRRPKTLDYDFDITLKAQPSMTDQELLTFSRQNTSHTQCLIGIWSQK